MNEDTKKDIQRLVGHYQDYQGLRLIPLGLLFGFAALGRWEAMPWGDFIYGDSDTFSMVLVGFLIASVPLDFFWL